MLMPSIFGENLFDDFFTPFYYDDKDEKKEEKKNWKEKEKRISSRQILRKNRKVMN